jgi:hypothetical protein
MEIKRLLLKEKTSLINEYIFYVQLNKKEMKDITLFTWTVYFRPQNILNFQNEFPFSAEAFTGIFITYLQCT